MTLAPPPRPRTRRDEDAEALEQALNESLQPDFLAQIVQAENELRHMSIAPARPAPIAVDAAVVLPVVDDDDDDDDVPADFVPVAVASENLEDANENVPFCHLPERMITLILEYLDEDSIGLFSSTCHHFHHTASTEFVYEMMCQRVFTTQCRGRPVKLGKFTSWAHMFRSRPRVKYNGFYALRISYYKEPEWNMWTDLPKNAILQAIYYRYFNFRNDGTFLYAMTHRHPRETAELMRHMDKET
ncbi:F-box protein, partial [Achlya hypogyna]